MPIRRPSLLTLSQLWLWIAIALPAVLCLMLGLATVDLAYQLRAGQEFLRTGSIATTDTFTFTLAGREWLNQQWGAQVFFAVVYGAVGWEGLHVLRAALVSLTFGLVVVAALRQGNSVRVASLLALSAFLVGLGTLSLRPQLLGMAFFATALVIVLERHRHPRIVWLLPLLGVVWANVHGSFFMLPVIAGYAWLEDLRSRDARVRHSFAILLACTLATLVNPFGIGVWRYAVGLSTSAQVTQNVTEWQPPVLGSIPGALFYASVLAVVLVIVRRSERPSPPTLLWLGFLFLIAVYAVRGLAWWSIGAAVAVAGLLGTSDIGRSRSERRGWFPTVVAAGILLAGVVLLPFWREPSPTTARKDLLAYAPAGITAYLQAEARPGERIFNPQPWGSWFEWIVPEAKVFIDARFELFTPEMWEDGLAINGRREDWKQLLDKWQVSMIVVDDERTRELGDRLTADDAWRMAYRDDDGRVFVRAGRAAP